MPSGTQSFAEHSQEIDCDEISNCPRSDIYALSLFLSTQLFVVYMWAVYMGLRNTKNNTWTLYTCPKCCVVTGAHCLDATSMASPCYRYLLPYSTPLSTVPAGSQHTTLSMRMTCSVETADLQQPAVHHHILNCFWASIGLCLSMQSSENKLSPINYQVTCIYFHTVYSAMQIAVKNLSSPNIIPVSYPALDPQEQVSCYHSVCDRST